MLMLERVEPPCLVFWTSGNLANIVFYATYIDLVQELPAEHAEVLLSGSADVYRQASNLKFNRTSVLAVVINTRVPNVDEHFLEERHETSPSVISAFGIG
jgi:hypothetical protein